MVVLAAMAHEVLEVEASLLPNRSLGERTALLGGRLLDRQPQDMGPTGGHLFQVESASKNKKSKPEFITYLKPGTRARASPRRLWAWGSEQDSSEEQLWGWLVPWPLPASIRGFFH